MLLRHVDEAFGSDIHVDGLVVDRLQMIHYEILLYYYAAEESNELDLPMTMTAIDYEFPRMLVFAQCFHANIQPSNCRCWLDNCEGILVNVGLQQAQ